MCCALFIFITRPCSKVPVTNTSKAKLSKNLHPPSIFYVKMKADPVSETLKWTTREWIRSKITVMCILPNIIQPVVLMVVTMKMAVFWVVTLW
jgi:hypothetical protein